jgi:hypothetical protein
MSENERIALRSNPNFYKRVSFYLSVGNSEQEAVKKAENELLKKGGK